MSTTETMITRLKHDDKAWTRDVCQFFRKNKNIDINSDSILALHIECEWKLSLFVDIFIDRCIYNIVVCSSIGLLCHDIALFFQSTSDPLLAKFNDVLQLKCHKLLEGMQNMEIGVDLPEWSPSFFHDTDDTDSILFYDF